MDIAVGAGTVLGVIVWCLLLAVLSNRLWVAFTNRRAWSTTDRHQTLPRPIPVDLNNFWQLVALGAIISVAGFIGFTVLGFIGYGIRDWASTSPQELADLATTTTEQG